MTDEPTRSRAYSTASPGRLPGEGWTSSQWPQAHQPHVTTLAVARLAFQRLQASDFDDPKAFLCAQEWLRNLPSSTENPAQVQQLMQHLDTVVQPLRAAREAQQLTSWQLYSYVWLEMVRTVAQQAAGGVARLAAQEGMQWINIVVEQLAQVENPGLRHRLITDLAWMARVQAMQWSAAGCWTTAAQTVLASVGLLREAHTAADAPQALHVQWQLAHAHHLTAFYYLRAAQHEFKGQQSNTQKDVWRLSDDPESLEAVQVVSAGKFAQRIGRMGQGKIVQAAEHLEQALLAWTILQTQGENVDWVRGETLALCMQHAMLGEDYRSAAQFFTRGLAPALAELDEQAWNDYLRTQHGQLLVELPPVLVALAQGLLTLGRDEQARQMCSSAFEMAITVGNYSQALEVYQAQQQAWACLRGDPSRQSRAGAVLNALNYLERLAQSHSALPAGNIDSRQAIGDAYRHILGEARELIQARVTPRSARAVAAANRLGPKATQRARSRGQ